MQCSRQRAVSRRRCRVRPGRWCACRNDGAVSGPGRSSPRRGIHASGDWVEADMGKVVQRNVSIVGVYAGGQTRAEAEADRGFVCSRSRPAAVLAAPPGQSHSTHCRTLSTPSTEPKPSASSSCVSPTPKPDDSPPFVVVRLTPARWATALFLPLILGRAPSARWRTDTDPTSAGLQRDLGVQPAHDACRRGIGAHRLHLQGQAGVAEPCGADTRVSAHVLVLTDQGHQPARHTRIGELEQSGVHGPVRLEELADLRRLGDGIGDAAWSDVAGCGPRGCCRGRPSEFARSASPSPMDWDVIMVGEPGAFSRDSNAWSCGIVGQCVEGRRPVPRGSRIPARRPSR